MSETAGSNETPPSRESEPATGPVVTGPPPPPRLPSEPHVVYVPQPTSRLIKAAAWVGIVAGSVFTVAVIFGAGFLVGKSTGDGGERYPRGPVMMHSGPAMTPMGPPGGFDRGPAFPGPFRSDGPIIEIPRPGTPPDSAGPTAPGRP